MYAPSVIVRFTKAATSVACLLIFTTALQGDVTNTTSIIYAVYGLYTYLCPYDWFLAAHVTENTKFMFSFLGLVIENMDILNQPCFREFLGFSFSA